ncbi:MAG: hypothetical protein B6242_07590 [Anaerolineaceae bacterium 4572_78]|nr:MAG: hypothetical protein B6242_07590 [Anaerolineaceae bacterium 4572_78]
MIFTIIPAKPFSQSKTHLANILSPQKREHVSKKLLQHTVYISNQASHVVGVSCSGKRCVRWQKIQVHGRGVWPYAPTWSVKSCFDSQDKKGF